MSATLRIHENHILRFQVWRTKLPSAHSQSFNTSLVAAFAEREDAEEYASEYITGDFTVADIKDLTVQS